MMRLSLMIVLLALCTQAGAGQHVVRTDSLYAPSLHRMMKYTIMLPGDYDPARRYPVLYMLHYFGGNHQTYATSALPRYLAGMPLIVVTPQADTLWYVNSATRPEERYEDYVVRDIVCGVERAYAIDTTKRAIAGLSMGGYGALLLGTRHPAMFRFIGSLSGAINVTDIARTGECVPAARFIMGSVHRIFDGTSKAFVDSNDVFQVYRATPAEKLPYVFVAVGNRDELGLNRPARILTEQMHQYGIVCELHEIPGGHFDENIVVLDFPIMLQRIREVLKF